MPQAADVRVTGLRKSYGDVAAVDGVDLEIGRGEFFTLLGPSGSGKTTTLRMIAGFERPDAGTVELGGRDVSSLPPFDRDVNTVFQDYALFPHMSVQENVEYGLRVKKVPKAERLVADRHRRVRESRAGQQRAVRSGLRDRAACDHGGLPGDHEAPRGVRVALMETRGTRLGLWLWAAVVFAFLWIPLAIMAVYAFNSSNIQSWPIPGFTTKWFSEAWHDDEVRYALWLSVRAGLAATGVALVLGSLAAFVLARARFFGRDSISFLFVLPIALPGIITASR